MLWLATRISNDLHLLAAGLGDALGRRGPALARDQSGASALEYALIVAGIGVAVAAVVFRFGINIEAYYEAIDSRIREGTMT